MDRVITTQWSKREATYRIGRIKDRSIQRTMVGARRKITFPPNVKCHGEAVCGQINDRLGTAHDCRPQPRFSIPPKRNDTAGLRPLPVDGFSEAKKMSHNRAMTMPLARPVRPSVSALTGGSLTGFHTENRDLSMMAGGRITKQPPKLQQPRGFGILKRFCLQGFLNMIILNDIQSQEIHWPLIRARNGDERGSHELPSGKGEFQYGRSEGQLATIKLSQILRIETLGKEDVKLKETRRYESPDTGPDVWRPETGQNGFNCKHADMQR
ncbi:hypothetical protein DFH09DRAFT_1072471 [Mycena vulgaris]|nr:hypothetical protein DFH09DRAFT_1072471 [Mycena vulgaris]